MRRSRLFHLTAALAFTSCAGDRPPLTAAYRGMVLVTPVEKPDFAFTATDGRPFDLRRETDGFVTLLFFGYTSCPDVCPLQMANLGRVMRDLPAGVRDRIKVVFVSTDPDRDSLPAIRRWLNAFDTSFVGLRAPMLQVNRALDALRLPGARIERSESGEVGVAHPSVVMAFTRDNFARVYYPSGISQDDWGHDLPLLVQDAGTGFAAAQPRVTRAFVVAPAGSAPIAIYATIVNPGDAPDTVRACDAELTTECGLHEQRTAGAMMTMHPIAGAVVPPHDTLRLLPGGVHAMLGRVARPPQPGDSVGITFYLARAGAVSVRAPVVAYGDLERALAAPRP